MAQQRALAASAGTHDHEHVAAINGEIQIAHQHVIAIRHGEILHHDMRVVMRRIGKIVGGVFSMIVKGQSFFRAQM
jgi:hypothetical protein